MKKHFRSKKKKKKKTIFVPIYPSLRTISTFPPFCSLNPQHEPSTLLLNFALLNFCLCNLAPPSIIPTYPDSSSSHRPPHTTLLSGS